MKRKMRRFADGGVTEGENPNIDDDVRSRAMKFVEDASEESRDIGKPVTRLASKSTSSVSKTVAPPKMDMEAEKGRMEDLVKKQALERVEPEDYMPGTGLLKGLLKRGLKTVGRDALTAPKRDLPELTSPTPRLPAPTPRLSAPKAETLTAMEKKEVSGMKSRVRKNDDAETAVRARAAVARGKDNDAASKSVRTRAKKALEGMKKGGSVSSASRRADGCAVRGKTRA